MDEFTAVGSLADPVRRQVYDYVAARDEPVGREQTAAETGLAAAHREVPPRAPRRRGPARPPSSAGSPGRTGPGAGRPAKLYCRAAGEVSVSLPPRSYDLVGSVLAGAVASSLAGKPLDEGARDEAHRRGHEAGSSYDGRGAGWSGSAGLMEREGFEPAVEDDGLTLRNCPFDALAKEQPALVCGVNLDYVGGALEGLGCDGLRARLEPAQDRCCVRVGHDDEHEQRESSYDRSNRVTTTRGSGSSTPTAPSTSTTRSRTSSTGSGDGSTTTPTRPTRSSRSSTTSAVRAREFARPSTAWLYLAPSRACRETVAR